MHAYLGELARILWPGPIAPALSSIDVLHADLHIHSQYSPDSRASVPAIIAAAGKQRLDIIAITDHYVDHAFVDIANGKYDAAIDGRISASSNFVTIDGSDKRLIIIRGKEITTREDFHILALGYTRPVMNFLPIVETLQAIQDAGGAAVIPHPLHVLSHGVGRQMLMQLLTDEYSRSLITAIEGFNANSYFPQFWMNMEGESAARVHRISAIASSDAHEARHVGSGRTILAGRLVTNSAATLSQSLREALEGHTGVYKRYVPVPQFIHWFLLPRFLALISGKPLSIRPPVDYEQY